MHTSPFWHEYDEIAEEKIVYIEDESKHGR